MAKQDVKWMDANTKCSECGKMFVRPTATIYKVKRGGRIEYQCSYGCWRKAEKEKEERKQEMKEITQENRLRELRDRSRLTLNEVSILTGYDITTISRHESGQRGLSAEATDKYASLYKVKTHELFKLQEM